MEDDVMLGLFFPQIKEDGQINKTIDVILTEKSYG